MTRRLFAYLGISLLSSLAVVFYFREWGIALVALFCALILLSSFILKNKRLEKSVCVFISAVMIFSILFFTLYDNSYTKKQNSVKDNSEAKIKATLIDSRKYMNEEYYYLLKTSKIDNKNNSCRVMLVMPYQVLDFEYGDEIAADVVLKKCDSNYYKSQRISFFATEKNYRLNYKIKKCEKKGIGYFPIFLREKLSASMRALFPDEEGQLCAAVCLGEKHSLSDWIYDSFKSLGMSHLIVVSGLHIGIIAWIVLLPTCFMKRRRWQRILRAAAAVFAIVLYMAITAFTPSVVRSGIMVIVALVVPLFLRNADSLNSLGLAAAVICILNPYSVADLGMLLSFASTLGIIVLTPILSEKFQLRFKEKYKLLSDKKPSKEERRRPLYFLKRIKWYLSLNTLSLAWRAYELFFVSVSAFVFIIPITLVSLGKVNPFSVLFSLIFSPLVFFLMAFALLGSILYYVPYMYSVAAILAVPARYIARFMIFGMDFFSGFSDFTLYFEKQFTLIWFSLSLVAALVAAASNRRLRAGIIAFAFSLSVLVGGWTAYYIADRNTNQITVSGYKDELIITLRKNGEHCVLYLSGNRYLNIFNERNINGSNKVKSFVAANSSTKYDSAAYQFLNEFDVETVMMYYNNKTAEDLISAAARCDRYEFFTSRECLTYVLCDGVTDTVINDGKLTWQFVKCGSQKVLIVPDEGDFRKLPENYRTCDTAILCGSAKNSDCLNCDNLIVTQAERSEREGSLSTARGDIIIDLD